MLNVCIICRQVDESHKKKILSDLQESMKLHDKIHKGTPRHHPEPYYVKWMKKKKKDTFNSKPIGVRNICRNPLINEYIYTEKLENYFQHIDTKIIFLLKKEFVGSTRSCRRNKKKTRLSLVTTLLWFSSKQLLQI